MQLQRRFCFLLAGTALLLLLVSHHVEADTIVRFLVVQTASIYGPDFNDSSAHFLDQQRSCRDLCSFCPTCNGFYCGEECICECSQDPTEHAKCIDLIKANSEKLGLVYDLFIQLPQKRSSRTRFGRRAKSPEEKNAGGKLSGFHKILFSNFATAKQVTVPEQTPDEAAKSIATVKTDASEKSVHVDPQSEEVRAKREDGVVVEEAPVEGDPDEIVAQPGFFVPANRRRPCFGRNRDFTKNCGPGPR
uniref:Uncharacterized protein n=1 Tax=Anopheles epiroticus TaxID=199890 RepID=A0A182PIN2_9DIPT